MEAVMLQIQGQHILFLCFVGMAVSAGFAFAPVVSFAMFGIMALLYASTL